MSRWRAIFAAFVLAACTLPAVAQGRAAASITLTETGSTLFYPLFRAWLPQFRKDNPDIRIETAGTGSGEGIAQAVGGRVQIGASDAFMSDAQLRGHSDILNIPLVISAESVNYNVPGLNAASLKLDGQTIAAIYSGKVRSWDAPEIAALNASLKLPHRDIVPVRRSDASGSTFIFTQFLSFSTPNWDNGPGFGETIDWPSVAGARTAAGSEGVLKTVTSTPYSIGYIGISYQPQIVRARIGTAMLKNENGAFVLPTLKSIYSAAAALGPRTPPDERLSLVYAPGEFSYPLINYEYAIVSKKQPNEQIAAAIRTFLFWAIEPCSGNSAKTLDTVHFIALPEYIRALSYTQVESIKGP
ncbi:MAG TPA: phosphate ABC transporter substrate-binding protein PstS [Candidatus Acidoferrales bacterium]|nr:phosphate ABC transporter substrate-binding protein PstS [Candidatus Acidoferrales bacterium]